jgi:hypothetical protein
MRSHRCEMLEVLIGTSQFDDHLFGQSLSFRKSTLFVSSLCDIPKHQDSTNDVAVLVPHWGRAVIDGVNRTIARNQDGMICKAHNLANAKGVIDWVFDLLEVVFSSKNQNIFDVLAAGIILFPPAETFSFAVQESDAAFGICRNHAVANA